VSEPVNRYTSPVGTALEMAKAVNRKLRNYGIKKAGRATERTIRFYATRKLIDKPERTSEDGRKAVFGQLQLYQACLLLALGPRGYKLESIRRVHRVADISQMDDMLRLVATTEAQIDDHVVGRNDVES
jgi:DNA-binding transcriptional MerR regulator